MGNLGKLKKIVCTVSGGKKICKRSIDGRKNFLPPENHDTTPPSPGGNNGPSLINFPEVRLLGTFLSILSNGYNGSRYKTLTSVFNVDS